MCPAMNLWIFSYDLWWEGGEKTYAPSTFKHHADIIIKDSIKMWYLIINHNSKTILCTFTKFSTIRVNNIARVCCKSQVLQGSVRLLRAFKVGAIYAATTVLWQPVFQVSSVQLHLKHDLSNVILNSNSIQRSQIRFTSIFYILRSKTAYFKANYYFYFTRSVWILDGD